MIVAALLGLGVLVSAPLWVLRRASPPGASSDWGRPTRRARRAMLLLAVLLLAVAWAVGEVVEEARIYAEVHALPSDVATQERAPRTA